MCRGAYVFYLHFRGPVIVKLDQRYWSDGNKHAYAEALAHFKYLRVNLPMDISVEMTYNGKTIKLE